MCTEMQAFKEQLLLLSVERDKSQSRPWRDTLERLVGHHGHTRVLQTLESVERDALLRGGHDQKAVSFASRTVDDLGKSSHHTTKNAENGRRKVSTPRGSRASVLREKASAVVRANFEKIDGGCLSTPSPRSTRGLAAVAFAPPPPRAQSTAPHSLPHAQSTAPHSKPSRSPQTSRTGTGADESAGEDARQVHATQQHQQLPSCQDSGPPDSEEQIRSACQRLAAKESALEAKRLRTAAQEVALEAMRAKMQQKLDRISELQDTAEYKEARLRKEEARRGKETERMQDRISLLEWQLDEERTRRRAAEQNVHIYNCTCVYIQIYIYIYIHIYIYTYL